VRAVEPVPVRGDRAEPLARGKPEFLLDQQAGRPGKDHGSAAARRDRADEADDEERPQLVEVQFSGVVPVPEPHWHLPGSGLGKGDQGAAPVARGCPGIPAEQVVDYAAHPRGQDPVTGGIALGGLQVTLELAPGRSVARTNAVRFFQLMPPLLFHRPGVGGRECLPDHHVTVALEPLEIGRSKGGES
jgi:hypothetical protein